MSGLRLKPGSCRSTMMLSQPAVLVNKACRRATMTLCRSRDSDMYAVQWLTRCWAFSLSFLQARQLLLVRCFTQ